MKADLIKGQHEKSTLEDLALFGGHVSFPENLHVGRPNVPDLPALSARIQAVLESRWLTNSGPLVEEFERRVAQKCGVRHCVAMCSGTIALQIAIRAAGLKGEVIVPSFTFVATAHALQWQEITPVFCDIDDTFCIDPGRVEELITPNTTGIVGVHLWGRTCNVEALSKIARRRNLTLLFDAAHSFGCSHGGTPVGGFGRAEILSFHATKFINTFEGGAVVTNDDEFADCCRSMRNFGFHGEDNVTSLGINGKMNEIEAAMGLTSLDHMDAIIATNYGNLREYESALRDLPGVRLIHPDPQEMNNFQYVVLEFSATAAISRDTVHALLQAEGLWARRYFYPGCHRMEPYRSNSPRVGSRLPKTERACTSMLSLPTGTAVSSTQIREICSLIRFAVHHGPEIESRMQNMIKTHDVAQTA